MSEYNKKSESIKTNTHTDESMTRRVLIVIFGLVETLLGFRFIFKLAGANPANTLIKILYDVTDLLVGVFASIFSSATNDGLETVSVIEPGTIIAMIVFALVALAISKLMAQATHTQRNTTQYTNVDHTLDDKKEVN